MNHLWLSLRYSSTMPVRIMLAVAMIVRALLILPAAFDAKQNSNIVYEFAAPLTWALAFGLIGSLLLWRIFDRRTRLDITRAINATACGVFGAYFLGVIYGLGYLPPGIADTGVLILASMWVTLRTDLTASDKETA